MATSDELGDRLKAEYEHATRAYLPRRTHTVIRLDGNAFRTYTRGLLKPFDEALHEDLVSATAFLLARVSGAQLAYVQSDEVSLLVTDFANPGTQPWFGGSVQKMASVSASILTAKFNELRYALGSREGERLAFFDSRVFTIDDPDDVTAYFQWRRLDATRNSVSGLARVHLSHREVQGKSTAELREVLLARGVLWSGTDPRFRYGTLIYRNERVEDVTFTDSRGDERVARDVKRHVWEAVPADDHTLLTHLESCLLG